MTPLGTWAVIVAIISGISLGLLITRSWMVVSGRAEEQAQKIEAAIERMTAEELREALRGRHG